MIFMSDEVMSENHCRITLRVTKIAVHGNPYIILFLHDDVIKLKHFTRSWPFGRGIHRSPLPHHHHHHHWKQPLVAHFAIVAKGGLFWLKFCDVTAAELRRHAIARYWYFEVIFINSSPKLHGYRTKLSFKHYTSEFHTVITLGRA